MELNQLDFCNINQLFFTILHIYFNFHKYLFKFLNFLPVKFIELIIIFSWVYIINITNFIKLGIQMLTMFIGYLILNYSYLNIEVINDLHFIIVHSLIILMDPIFKTFKWHGFTLLDLFDLVIHLFFWKDLFWKYF